MAIIVPPREVFEMVPTPVLERLSHAGYEIPNFKKITKSAGGEMLSYFEGHPVPRKGMQYPEAVLANNQVKRATMAMLASFAGLRRGFTGFIEEYLHNYCRLVDAIYNTCERVPYLKPEYYNTTSKGVWTLVETFLWEIGIKKNISIKLDINETATVSVASRVGQIVATILEYDDAYRMPVVDVMSEFTKEEILKSPIKFVKKAIKIFSDRSDNGHLKDRFNKFSVLLRILLWLPKYRRAFRKAFEKVNLKLLQYDESDYYWSLLRGGYNSQGRTLENRLNEVRQRIKEFIE